MDVTLGLHLDSPTWPFIPDGKQGALGAIATGPAGLLRVLETQLGLPPVEIEPVRRILNYNRALKACDNGKRFYSTSFSVDPLGVARALLAWRDELALEGYAFQADVAEIPTRLADLCAVESIFASVAAIAFGAAENLKRVILAMTRAEPEITRLTLVDAKSEFPQLWQILITALQNKGVQILEFHFPIATATGDLLLLQQCLLRQPNEKVNFAGDGSLFVVSLESESIAAEMVSSIVEEWNPEKNLIISETSAQILDRVRSERGLPASGISSTVTERPIMQLLTLAFGATWNPPDLTRLLEFLMMRLAPGSFGARRKLARVLAKKPGVGNLDWNAALESAREGKYGDEFELLKYWYEPMLLAEQAAPTAKLVDRLARLGAWAGACTGSKDSRDTGDQLKALASRAKLLSEILQEVGGTISRLEFEKWLKLVSSSSDARGYLAEGGSIPAISSPANMLETAERLIWFECAGDSLLANKMPHWQKMELHYLQGLGVRCPAPADQIESNWRKMIRPILQVKDQVLLFTPGSPETKNAAHPLVEYIYSIAKNKEILRLVGLDSTLGKTPGIARATLPYQPLPERRKHWDLDELLSMRKIESYSSLEALFYRPFEYVLHYGLDINPGSFYSIPADFTLSGTIAHRLLEKLFKETSSELRSDERELSGWFDKNFDKLLREEGIPLMRSGAERARHELRMGTQRTCLVLQKRLDISGMEIVKMEAKFDEQQLDSLNVFGSIDVIVADKNTGKQVGVLDLKWAGGTKHSANIQNGKDLQLVIYARAIKETSSWPKRGYLIISRQRFLLADAWLGQDGNVAANAPAIDTIWSRIQNTYEFRKEQLHRGLIEIESLAPAGAADLLDLQEPPSGYHSYQVLLRVNDV